MITTILTAAVLAQAAAPTSAAAPAGNSVSVTIYSTADVRGFDPQRFVEQQRAGWDPQAAWSVPGYGVVRETRRMNIPKGSGWVTYENVAQFMDPSTVLFSDLTDPATQVLEQRMEFDLVNGDKLMQKYLDREVTLETTAGDKTVTTTGRLLSASGGQAVLQTASGIVILPSGNAKVTLGSLPEGLRVKPSLLWNTESAAGGAHDVRVDYQTGGLTWRADYNLAVNPDETTAALAAWVSLLNVSGTTYQDAELRLIAGDVHRVRPQPVLMERMSARGGIAADAKAFSEESVGEYHRYTLPRKIDLPSNSTQQMTLFPTVQNLKVKKELVFAVGAHGGYGGKPNVEDVDDYDPNAKVGVWYVIDNSENAGLGMPLPAGKVRVSQVDAKGSGEFIGEDVIDHTARGATLRLDVGTSFDVTAKRERMDFKIDRGRSMASETITITVKNGKKNKAETVIVRDRLWRWSSWTVEGAQVDGKPVEFKKENAQTMSVPVTVPADGQAVFSYTVRYSW